MSLTLKERNGREAVPKPKSAEGLNFFYRELGASRQRSRIRGTCLVHHQWHRLSSSLGLETNLITEKMLRTYTIWPSGWHQELQWQRRRGDLWQMHLFSGTEGKIQLVVRMSESQHHGTFNDGSQAHDFRETKSKRLKTVFSAESATPHDTALAKELKVWHRQTHLCRWHTQNSVNSFCACFPQKCTIHGEAVFKTVEHWIRPCNNNRSTVIKVQRAKEALSECVL